MGVSDAMTKEERGFYWALLIIGYAIALLSVFGVYDWINEIVTGEQLRKQVPIWLLMLISLGYVFSLSIPMICLIQGTAMQRVASAMCLALSAVSLAGLAGLFFFDHAYLYFGPD